MKEFVDAEFEEAFESAAAFGNKDTDDQGEGGEEEKENTVNVAETKLKETTPSPPKRRSPKVSPKESPKNSPKESPKASPEESPEESPRLTKESPRFASVVDSAPKESSSHVGLNDAPPTKPRATEPERVESPLPR